MTDPRDEAIPWTRTVIQDTILAYWLNGTEDEDLRAWWSTDDAVETAGELADAIVEALRDASRFRSAVNEYETPGWVKLCIPLLFCGAILGFVVAVVMR